MEILDQVRNKIMYLHTCNAAYILAHAAWSACDHRELPGPSVISVSASLDSSNVELVYRLQQITTHMDYSNDDQAKMLRWLHDNGYSRYVAKQVKTTMKKLIDWS